MSYVLIENYYAGVLHGTQLEIIDGKPRAEFNYHYGIREGIYRAYREDGNLDTEDDCHEGKPVTRRIWHPNGNVDRWVVAGIVWDHYDLEGKSQKTDEKPPEEPSEATEATGSEDEIKPAVNK